MDRSEFFLLERVAKNTDEIVVELRKLNKHLDNVTYEGDSIKTVHQEE